MSEEDFDAVYNNCDEYDPDGMGHPHQRSPHGQTQQRNNSIQQHNRRTKAQHVSSFLCPLEKYKSRGKEKVGWWTVTVRTRLRPVGDKTGQHKWEVTKRWKGPWIFLRFCVCVVSHIGCPYIYIYRNAALRAAAAVLRLCYVYEPVEPSYARTRGPVIIRWAILKGVGGDLRSSLKKEKR